ncbi:MAG: ferrous iron transport protein A [Candidatus Bathyarchaeota archaeon]|nr:MAG: ferrous iron transport protein A [Candidatus Bathyarchaeota archaeon]
MANRGIRLERSLVQLKDGESGIIVSINDASPHNSGHHRHRWGFRKRLEDMGLTPGTKVTLIRSAPFHGPVELRVRGSKLALGRGMAKRVFVKVDG